MMVQAMKVRDEDDDDGHEADQSAKTRTRHTVSRVTILRHHEGVKVWCVCEARQDGARMYDDFHTYHPRWGGLQILGHHTPQARMTYLGITHTPLHMDRKTRSLPNYLGIAHV